MDKKFYVYLYRRSTNSKHGAEGSPYYVGKGSGRRAWSNTHRVKPPTNRSLVEIIAEGLNEPDALQAEMLLIRMYGRADKGTGCLRNYTDGGEFTQAFRGMTCPMKGKKHTEEAKAKMAAMKLGHKTGPHSKEWNQNISQSQIGKIVSPETALKISQGNKGRKMRPRSPEHCEAIRQAKIGRKRPDMLSGSELQLKSAITRSGVKRGPYNRGD